MPLAILTKRKELHGFLFLCIRVVPFSIIMGLRLAALWAAGAPLKSFSLNKVPGKDGLPVEFYKTFWGTVGELLVKYYNESYEKGEMSFSQKQVIITLINKKDQDRCDLKNWRPISLLNVDAKIASKVIAE